MAEPQTEPKPKRRYGKRPQKFRETEIARLRRIAPDCSVKINKDGSLELIPVPAAKVRAETDEDLSKLI